MGNKSSAITINLDRSNLFYFTGETISGTVGLSVTEGKVEADEVYIELTGEIGYTTTRTVHHHHGSGANPSFGHCHTHTPHHAIGHTNDYTTTEIDYHHVPFYTAKAVFSKLEPGQKAVVYTKGNYSWPFQIPLSTHLPPTMYEPQSYPHVKYYLQVVIDKPWYKPNTRERRYLTICPHVNLLQNPQCLQSTIFGNQNRKDIILKGTLNKTGYVPGELVHITIEIENPKRVLIKSIDFSMIQSSRIGEMSRDFNIFQTTLPNIMNTKDEHIKQSIPVKLPSMILPPSYQFQGGLQRAAFVTNQYMLKLVARVEGFFTNFDISIPIILGTEPNPDQNHEHMSNLSAGFYGSNLEQPMFTNHDLPPTYESVVQYKQ
ncbi:unnamed protein product [Rotaria sp. Silwood1]|nr:unnamed protein product [Rotaria sp. Silwood1]CAF1635181.1 unnamed protein product [Rotaria sp. Silwood1]CAF3460974.1 unnamed protein product [Rotaria sp. Silwood1]CAF3773034.1 unnamed protein product [Rotaria sp. Silwood1]CAF3803413.1 unnamed protein product [Rotaria sp. Silwood1]